MLYAIAIKMRNGCTDSQSLLEIDEIRIDNGQESSLHKKEYLYDYLKANPNSIKVNCAPSYPYLIPAVSSRDEKYVRSTPNNSTKDNLLNLPRE